MTEPAVDEILRKIQNKVKASIARDYAYPPYTTKNGHFVPMEGDITRWTNGFWPGLNWLLYLDTQEEIYKNEAVKGIEMLDQAFAVFDGIHHDVGFMWHITSGLHYRMTGDNKSRIRTLTAANLLMGRFNLQGQYIRAWNDKPEEKNIGWSIIDTMMNLPILYWASEEIADPRFRYVAQAHADTCMRHHIRPDGSVKHIVVFDPESGEEVDELGGQGFAPGSSWSRGQAWAIYGFLLSYRYTKNPAYLDVAKKVAHYFIANARITDWLPLCDFRSPKEPVIYDATAGAIAACGLLELSQVCHPNEADVYRDAALNLLEAIEKKCCDWDTQTDGIVDLGTERYHQESTRHMKIIYGDFFYTEAMLKLKGNTFQIW